MRSKNGPVVQEEPSFIEAARREQIIRCAIDTIAEVGYQRASLYEIASRARVSKGVIAYYFTSKDELMRQVIEEIYATAKRFMLPEVERHEGHVSEMLTAFIRSNVAYIRAHTNEVRALAELANNFRPSNGQLPLEAGSNKSASELAELFAYGQTTGEFRAFNVKVMAAVLRASIDALAQWLATAPEPQVKTYEDELVDLFERATTADRGKKAQKENKR